VEDEVFVALWWGGPVGKTLITVYLCAASEHVMSCATSTEVF